MNRENNIGLQGMKNKKERAFINLRGVHAEVKITGNICYCEISQQFVNTEKVSVEAVYSFPLPMDATICSFSVIDNEKILKSKIMKRDDAFDKYDDALMQGNRAFLLDQDRPNLFTTSVGNLKPGQDITVKIEYVQLISRYKNICKFVFPTTLAPVYTPPKFLQKMDPAEIDRLYPPFSLSTLPYGLSINIETSMPGGIKSIDSPTHSLKTQFDKDKVNISFSTEKVSMDRDFIIEIEANNNLDNKILLAEDKFDKGFIALSSLILPEKKQTSENRNIIFLIDCSGSMNGTRIDQAKNALFFALSSLLIGDKFNIIAYGSNFKCLSDSLIDYNQDSLKKARSWVSEIDADMGGTEVFSPIKHIIENQTDAQQDVILLTDGDVGNQKEIIEYLRQQNSETRFFTIGVGLNCGEYLLKSLSDNTKGFMEILNNTQKIETVLNRQYARIRTKAIVKAEIISDLQTIDISHLIKSVFYDNIVNFFLHCKDNPGLKLEIVLSFENDEIVRMNLPVEFIKDDNFKGIEQLYAKFMIDNVLPYQTGSKQKNQLNKTTDIALKYSILSENTSFVVEDTLKNKDKSGSIALRRVPVMMPADNGFSLAGLGFNAVMSCIVPYQKKSLIQEASQQLLECCQDLAYNKTDDNLINIINLQSAYGYWDNFDEISQLTKISKRKFTEKTDNIKQKLNTDETLAKQIALTVLILEYLDKKFRDQYSEWCNVANKANKFISENGYQVA